MGEMVTAHPRQSQRSAAVSVLGQAPGHDWRRVTSAPASATLRPGRWFKRERSGGPCSPEARQLALALCATNATAASVTGAGGRAILHLGSSRRIQSALPLRCAKAYDVQKHPKIPYRILLQILVANAALGWGEGRTNRICKTLT